MKKIELLIMMDDLVNSIPDEVVDVIKSQIPFNSADITNYLILKKYISIAQNSIDRWYDENKKLSHQVEMLKEALDNCQ